MRNFTSIMIAMVAISAPASAADGVPFPGPAISATTVSGGNGQWTVGNNTLTATYTRDAGGLRLANLRSALNGLDLSWADPNLFTIYLGGNAKPVASSAMKLTGDPESDAIAGESGAARLSHRLPGRMLSAILTDESAGLSVRWRAIMTDGANVLRQEIQLRATRGPLLIDRIEMARASMPDVAVCGYTDGAVLTTGKLFLGIEHPLARNEVQSGALAVCALPRQFTLEKDHDWTVSSAIGVYPAGQLRRSFLYYLERERAHPYRQYWHYNSWYDLNIRRNDNPDPLKRMTEAQCLEVIGVFGKELHDQRGVGINGFVWDDGWDDWNSLWGFHRGFPNGFSKLKAEAAKQDAGMGAWLSPWGGYSESHDQRVAFGKAHGYETNSGGFSLGGPKYYQAFRDVCLKMIRDYGQNYFKFDGIGGGPFATGAPAGIAPDLDGLVRVLGELRAAKPDLFVNCTIGTWASPYWTWFADSVWRQGSDCEFAGEGNKRERWITYRDKLVYERFAKPSPLYPLNSIMYHGLLVCERGLPGEMPKPAQEIESYRHEALMAVGFGSGLGELYVSPSLMTCEAWDILAAGIKWSRAHQDILRDTHWIGGHPLTEIYGYASWHPELGGTIVLRNPTTRDLSFTLDPQKVFELPPGAPQRYRLTPAMGTDDGVLHASAAQPLVLTLPPFAVRIWDASAE